MPTDGIGPGGNISAIVYESYLGGDGWPRTAGVSWDPYFSAAYYRKEVPVWERYAPGLFSEAGTDGWLLARGLASAVLAAMALFLGAAALAGRRG